MEGLALSLYFSPAYPTEGALPLARRLAAVVREHTPQFRPHLSMDEALLAAERDQAFETLFAPISLIQVSPDGKSDFLLSINQAREEKANGAVVGCSTPFLRLERPQVQRAWLFLTSIASPMIEATSPVFAEINAVGERGVRFSKLRPAALPPVFGPWNYLGPSLVEGERGAVLEALPDCKLSRFHGGMVVQVVPDLYGKPSPALLAALHDLRIKYHARQPPQDGG
jgi:hypothetical protein